MRRAACAEWPRILNPAPGCFPPAAPLRQDERVLHVALHPDADLTQVLPRAFAKIASAYGRVDWQRADTSPGGLAQALESEARRIRPTLVWMQMQGPSSLDEDTIKIMRRESAPLCVMMQWDGDLYYQPANSERSWFIDLGRLLDASLTSETHFQEEYARRGVKRPGFLEIGMDGKVFLPHPEIEASARVVFLGSYYRRFAHGYVMRSAVVGSMSQTYGPERFSVHGTGWGENCCVHAPIQPYYEPAVYANAAAAISTSIYSHITRYTSDRLFRMLCAGALSLVERFPDFEGLGLVDGENCLMWSTLEELHTHVDAVLANPNAPRWREMRTAAGELGKFHTWDARMPELLAIVDAIRSDR